MNKTQREANDEEWRNRDNWSGVWIWKVYFSKRDSRIWVPLWWNGRLSPQTINLGNRWGFLVLNLMFYWAIAIFAGIAWILSHQK